MTDLIKPEQWRLANSGRPSSSGSPREPRRPGLSRTPRTAFLITALGLTANKIIITILGVVDHSHRDRNRKGRVFWCSFAFRSPVSGVPGPTDAGRLPERAAMRRTVKMTSFPVIDRSDEPKANENHLKWSWLRATCFVGGGIRC